MDNGWIKLHRKILDNDIFRNDLTAWHVFEVLLLVVNKSNAKWSGGRFQLAELCKLNPNTTYKAIKRLEKAKMITLSSNNKFTIIYICNWSKYQVGSNSFGNNKVTTKEQQSNTLTRIKNKELRNKYMSVSDETRQVYELFLEEFDKSENKYKLTPKRKAMINRRLKDAGLEMCEEAIRRAASDPFYRGDNNRGWKADLDFIFRSFEQVEKLSQLESSDEDDRFQQAQEKWLKKVKGEQNA